MRGNCSFQKQSPSRTLVLKIRVWMCVLICYTFQNLWWSRVLKVRETDTWVDGPTD